VVGDNLDGDVGRRRFAKLYARERADRLDQGRDEVGLEYGGDPLLEGGHPLEAHPGIDVLLGQRVERLVGLPVVLHEDEVPDLEEPVAVAAYRAGRRPAADLRPEVAIALHAPLACIDDANQSALGRWLAERTGLPFVTDVGYPTPGSFGTWGREHELPVITYEFPLADADALVRDHVPVLLELLTRTDG